MRPAVIYDVLVDVLGDAVTEAQSTDQRPFHQGIFCTVRFEEPVLNLAIQRGPRIMTVALHQPWNESRDYGPLEDLHFLIHNAFKTVENEVGSDNVMVSSIRRTGGSGNLEDEGWQTIKQTATYGVLYHKLAA